MKTVLRKHAIPTDAETREIVPGVVFTLPLEHPLGDGYADVLMIVNLGEGHVDAAGRLLEPELWEHRRELVSDFVCSHVEGEWPSDNAEFLAKTETPRSAAAAFDRTAADIAAEADKIPF